MSLPDENKVGEALEYLALTDEQLGRLTGLVRKLDHERKVIKGLAYLDATILPPVPAFYIGGEDFTRFLDHYVLRVLDALGIHEPGKPGLRWPG